MPIICVLMVKLLRLQRYEKNVMQQKEKDVKRLSDLFYI